MCIPSFKILAIIVLEKTVTQKNLTELRSYVIMELRTDQIQYSPTSPLFQSGAINRENSIHKSTTQINIQIQVLVVLLSLRVIPSVVCWILVQAVGAAEFFPLADTASAADDHLGQQSETT